MTSSPKIDVFISRKSTDRAMAEKLYDYLTAKGLTVFDSDKSLPTLGNSDYRDAIDQALDQCTHMIVIGSSAENISSSWVKAEWGFYIGEKRADRKSGNILTVIAEGMEIKDLPASLRNYEVISFGTSRFERIGRYVGLNNSAENEKKAASITPETSSKPESVTVQRPYIYPEGVKVSNVPKSIFFGNKVLIMPTFAELGFDNKLSSRALLKSNVKVGQWINRDDELFELTLKIYSADKKPKYFWQSDLTFDVKIEMKSPVSGLVVHLKEDNIGYYTPYPMGRTPMVYGNKGFFPVILLPDNEPPMNDYYFKEFYLRYWDVLSDCWSLIQFSHRDKGYVRMNEVYDKDELRFISNVPEIENVIHSFNPKDYATSRNIQSLRTDYYDLRDKLLHLVE